MLYREIIAVCSQIHTKHINTLCGKNVEFLDLLATQLGKSDNYLHHVCLSVSVSARNNSVTAGHIFMKFCV